MIAISTRPAGVFDTDGAYAEGYEIHLSLTDAEVVDLLSRYTPDSGTSPGVSDARPLARVILDALIVARGGQDG